MTSTSTKRPEIKMVPYPENAEAIYSERYNLIKEIVYELEDENDLIALKIAQFEQRVEALRKTRTNGSAEQPLKPDPTPAPLDTASESQPSHSQRDPTSQLPPVDRRPDPRADSIFSSQLLPQYPGHIPTPPPPPTSNTRQEDETMDDY